MPSPEPVSFNCLELKQPIGTFYLGAMDARDLVAISYADIRRIELRDVEEYLGVQRTLNLDRVKEIAEYVHTVDATFPTSVILAVESKSVDYDQEKGVLLLPHTDNVAKIIDGQHRIAGLKHLRPGIQFMVNVTIFVDMELEDQATVFSTINLSQTKVNRSLVYDLYEYAKSRSPQKTAHNIARLLNKKEGSPFRKRIKILGVATPGERLETLTQASFVARLLDYITQSALADRDLLKRNKPIPPTPVDVQDRLIFREMFREGRDEDIALVLWNYFSAVEEKWPGAWKEAERGNILNRTTGFAGLMRFLRTAYNMYGRRGQVPPTSFFSELFEKSTLVDSDFNPETFPPGGSGEARLVRKLEEDVSVVTR